jgi:hypothetical protein
VEWGTLLLGRYTYDMDEHRARVLLVGCIREDGITLHCPWTVRWIPGDKHATMYHCEASPDFLEALAWWMRNMAKPNA